MPSATLFKKTFPFIVIALAGFIAYSNTFDVPFHYDDHIDITGTARENIFDKWSLEHYVDPSRVEKLGLNPIDRRHLETRYVAFLTFWLNHRLGGFDVFGYHVVNLFIHVLNAVLVYLLMLLTFKTPRLSETSLKKYHVMIAVFAGLVFVSHPVQIEAVTYVSKRVTALAATFCLLTAVFYVSSRLRAEERSRYGFYALSVLSAVLAMKTKEISFTLPLAIALYELMFFKGPAKKRVLILVPLFLTMVIIPYAYIVESDSGSIAVSLEDSSRLYTDMSRSEYLFTQFRVIVTYMRLLVFPVNQNLDYDYPVFTSVGEPKVLGSVVILAVMVLLGGYLFFRSRTKPELRLVSFGVFWFFLTLSVESSIFPLVELAVEYRVYLPSIGAIIAFVTAVSVILERLPNAKKATVAFFTVMVIALSGAAHERNELWQDGVTLWEDVVKKSPGKSRGYNMLGIAYMDQLEHDKAIEHYLMAIEMDPESEQAHYNLGRAYGEKGEPKKAMKYYRKSIELDPESSRAHYNLGLNLFNQGMVDEAIAQYESAISLNPDSKKAYYNLCIAYGSKGLGEEAIKQYKRALEIDPDYADAHSNLGNIYREKGMFDKALEHLGRAAALDPANKAAQYDLGLTFLSMGMRSRAMGHFMNVVQLDPDDFEAHYDLGVLYWVSGHDDEAIEQYEHALRIKPDLEDAHHNVALAYAAKGLLEEAMEHLRIALKLNPDDAMAHMNLGVLYLENGKADMAREQLGASLRLEPNNEQARKVLEEIDRK